MRGPREVRGGQTMKHVVVRWLILTLAVWVATYIVPGLGYENWKSLVIAALVLGVLNAFVKPILQMLAIPFIILTLGFFLLVINALLLRLTGWLVPGFHVAGFWPAVGGSLVISIVSFFLGYSGHRRIEVRRHGGPSSDARPPPGRGPIIDV